MEVKCKSCMYELDPWYSEHCDGCCGAHSNYKPRLYPSQIRELYIDYTEYGRNQATEFKKLADAINVSEKALKKAFSSERYYRKFWKKYFGVDIGEPPFKVR